MLILTVREGDLRAVKYLPSELAYPRIEEECGTKTERYPPDDFYGPDGLYKSVDLAR